MVKNESMGMQGIKKWIILLAVMLILAVIASFVVRNRASGQSLFDYFFSNQEESFVEGLLEDVNQTVEIDDYTITLKQALYESNTQIGYCMFEVTKNGGKPEAAFDSNNTLRNNTFGEGSRFSFCIHASCGETKNAEIKGNKLIVYYNFDITETEEPFRNEVILEDANEKDSSTVSGHREYSFQLKETKKGKKYEADGNTILYISPLGIAVESDKAIPDQRIEIVTTDGESKVLVDTQNGVGTNGSGESVVSSEEGTKARYVFHFFDLMDVETISHVIFNGEEL